jgi:hypothetical protein
VDQVLRADLIQGVEDRNLEVFNVGQQSAMISPRLVAHGLALRTRSLHERTRLALGASLI